MIKAFRNITHLLLVIFLFSILAFSVSASTQVETGKLGDEVYYSFNRATGTLRIEGEGEIWDFAPAPPKKDNLERPASSPFENTMAVKEIIISNGITRVGDYTFHFCRNVEQITFGNDIQEIGHRTFYGINCLDSVVFPASLEKLETASFDIANLTVCFTGDAPITESNAFSNSATLYFTDETQGWASPEWNGYEAYPIPYSDIPLNAWYLADVLDVHQSGLMNGVDTDRFAPLGVVSRAQVVTILYRLNGSPVVSQAQPFTDVPTDSWYTDAVLWAAETGVVTGYPSGLFKPTNDVTREQLATLFWRAAAQMGLDISARADLSTFPDAASVSGWAKEAMQWAVAEGILTGSGTDGTAYLNPTGSAQRCQLATILNRFCESNDLP